MSLKFCSISSGSSGNCYLIKSDTTALLVDAGISAKKILNGLDNTDTCVDNLKGLLITHEHIDHARSVSTLVKKVSGIKAYANEKTWQAIDKKIDDDRKETFITGNSF